MDQFLGGRSSESEFIGIPISWENDKGGYVATILPIGTICEIYPDACNFESASISGIPTSYPSDPTANTSSSSDSSQTFHTLDLEDSINEWTWYLGLNRGQITLGDGLPFLVGRELNTRGCRQDISATTVDVAVNVNFPQKIYFLVNTGNGFSPWQGQKVGEFVFVFSTGQWSKDLVLGENIRDWARSPEPGVVTTVTSPNTSEISSGSGYDGREGRVDLVVVTIPEEYRNSLLQIIRVNDTTGGYASSGIDPCIQIQAITVGAKQQ